MRRDTGVDGTPERRDRLVTCFDEAFRKSLGHFAASDEADFQHPPLDLVHCKIFQVRCFFLRSPKLHLSSFRCEVFYCAARG